MKLDPRIYRGLELSIQILQQIKEDLEQDNENIDLTLVFENHDDVKNVVSVLDAVRAALVVSHLIKEQKGKVMKQ